VDQARINTQNAADNNMLNIANNLNSQNNQAYLSTNQNALNALMNLGQQQYITQYNAEMQDKLRKIASG
jgi:hypothetical protein